MHILFVVLLVGCWGNNPANAKLDKLIILGTGGPSGVYSKVGRRLCNQVNSLRNKKLVRCIDYASAGSFFNVQSVLSRNIDLGIAGSDVAYELFNEKQGGAKNLRIVALLYKQPTAILVSKNSKIQTFRDFPGRSINIGNIGSGKRVTANIIFRSMAWNTKSFSNVLEMGSGGAGKMFCRNKLDIMIDILGHPSSFYQNIIENCNGKLISLPSSLINSLISKYPYFRKQKIKATNYSKVDKDIDTFGSVTLIVTNAKISSETIHHFLEAIFDDLATLQASHPALSNTKENFSELMSIGVPLHEGAKQFYRRNKN